MTPTLFYGDRPFCHNPQGAAGFRRPCRKCNLCRKRRSRDWRDRVIWEVAQSARTWWCTFTFRDVPQSGAYKAFQDYMKRLRKSGAHVRYISTQERGDRNGRIHFHALLHGPSTLKKRDVEAAWSEGFSKIKLLPSQRSKAVARYVGKYAAKDGRLRASVGYGGKALTDYIQGRKANDVYGDIVAAAFAAFPGASIVKVDGARQPYNFRKIGEVLDLSGANVGGSGAPAPVDEVPARPARSAVDIAEHRWVFPYRADHEWLALWEADYLRERDLQRLAELGGEGLFGGEGDTLPPVSYETGDSESGPD